MHGVIALETIDHRAAARNEMMEVEGGGGAGHDRNNSDWCWTSYQCFGYAQCENPYDVFDKPD